MSLVSRYREASKPVVGHGKQPGSGGVFGVIEATTAPVASGFALRAGNEMRSKQSESNCLDPNTVQNNPKRRSDVSRFLDRLVPYLVPKSLSQTVPQIWTDLVPNETPSRNTGGSPPLRKEVSGSGGDR